MPARFSQPRADHKQAPSIVSIVWFGYNDTTKSLKTHRIVHMLGRPGPTANGQLLLLHLLHTRPRISSQFKAHQSINLRERAGATEDLKGVDDALRRLGKKPSAIEFRLMPSARRVQGSAKRLLPGLVNFVLAVAYHFCHNMPE